MNRADKIKELKELKVYSGLLKDGIIPVSVDNQFEIHEYYKARLHVNQQFKDPVNRSKTESSEVFQCSEITIYRAVNYMEGGSDKKVLE